MSFSATVVATVIAPVPVVIAAVWVMLPPEVSEIVPFPAALLFRPVTVSTVPIAIDTASFSVIDAPETAEPLNRAATVLKLFPLPVREIKPFEVRANPVTLIPVTPPESLIPDEVRFRFVTFGMRMGAVMVIPLLVVAPIRAVVPCRKPSSAEVKL